MADKLSNYTQDPSRTVTVSTKTGPKLVLLTAITLIYAVGVIVLAGKFVESKRVETIDSLEKRLTLLADSREEIINTWLTGLVRQCDRLTGSDLFRLYASEIDLVKDDLAGLFGVTQGDSANLPENLSELAAQLPLMQNVLREFTTQAGFLSARILNKNGRPYIATDGYLQPPADSDQTIMRQAMEEGRALFSPLRKTDQGLELGIFIPLFPPDATEQSAPVGLLMMTRQVTGRVTELLSNSSFSAKGERTRLIQKENGQYREVAPWTGEGLLPTPGLTPSTHLDFGMRSGMDGDSEVFSLGVPVRDTQWVVVQERDANDAMASYAQFRRSVYLMAAMAVLMGILAACLLWWILAGAESKRNAEAFRTLAAQIDAQKRLIDNINSSMDEFVTLKDPEGRYLYVNEAFAEATGRERDELIGMDDEAVFGFDTGKRLRASDEDVMESQDQVVEDQSVYLRSKRHQFHISKSPYMDADGQCVGVVSVFRDVTAFVDAQEKNRMLVRRAMTALLSTVEAADPYLGGHSLLLAGLAVDVAKLMRMPERDIAELETSAQLSQIGKVFIPREILTKPGSLDAEETAIMQQHVEHAYRILKDIHIEENVLLSVSQMNERLDGSGYPKGIAGEQIIMPARILGVVNAFCAMIRPRSYRGAIPTDEALDILRRDESMDQEVVGALAEAISTPLGERIIAQATS